MIFSVHGPSSTSNLESHQRRVIQYVESVIPSSALDAGTSVTVLQVACNTLGCVPLETVILILFPCRQKDQKGEKNEDPTDFLIPGIPQSSSQGGNFQTKILLPLCEVTQEDVYHSLPPDFYGGRSTTKQDTTREEPQQLKQQQEFYQNQKETNTIIQLRDILFQMIDQVTSRDDHDTNIQKTDQEQNSTSIMDRIQSLLLVNQKDKQNDRQLMIPSHDKNYYDENVQKRKETIALYLSQSLDEYIQHLRVSPTLEQTFTTLSHGNENPLMQVHPTEQLDPDLNLENVTLLSSDRKNLEIEQAASFSFQPSNTNNQQDSIEIIQGSMKGSNNFVIRRKSTDWNRSLRLMGGDTHDESGSDNGKPTTDKKDEIPMITTSSTISGRADSTSNNGQVEKESNRVTGHNSGKNKNAMDWRRQSRMNQVISESLSNSFSRTTPLEQWANREHTPGVRKPGCPCCDPDNPTNVSDLNLMGML